MVADAGATPRFFGGSASAHFPISGLAADDVLLLRGLELDCFQPFESNEPLIEVAGSAGTVWIEDCALKQGGPAVKAGPGTRVVLERGTAEGAHGYFSGLTTVLPGGGLEVEGEVTVHGTTVTGGAGKDGQPWSGFLALEADPGAPAARVAGGGVLHVLDATLRGGAGGDGSSFLTCIPPAPGGAGLHLLPGDPAARIFDAALEAGATGDPWLGCPPTSPGPRLLQEGGTLGPLAGPAPALEAGAVAREGQVLTAKLQGEPGAFAFLAVGAAPAAFFLAPLVGTLLVDAPQVFAVGPLPPSGLITLAATVGELGPGVQGMLFPLQAAACGSGGCALGAGSVAVLLDAGL